MVTEPRNVYLIGSMGSGKTTIGQKLARKLNLQFYDCDREIEERTGASVNLIFDIEGEAGFRKRETGMLEELTAKTGVLVATGGGAVLSGHNRDLLKNSGIVVYLQTSVKQQLDRLRMDKTRPLLPANDREAKLRQLAAARNPLYEELADMVFPAHNRNVDSAVTQIYQAITDFQRVSGQPPGNSGPTGQAC